MIRDAEPCDHFILNVAGYPNRTMEQTRFVVDECREYVQLASWRSSAQ